MNDNNKKISEILEKYKSSFSKNDLLNLESLLSPLEDCVSSLLGVVIHLKSPSPTF